MINAICCEEPQDFPSPISSYIKEIVLSLLEKNPDKRPSAKELL
jgi:hypothetical protein